jgi:conjugal transfer ATP-binding protein TraC
MKKIIKKIEGIFTKKDEIAPAYINTKNPKNIEIDGTYYSGIIIVNYNRENTELILRKIIDTNINMNISCFYEKQDAYKTIRNLSYHIANVGVDLKDGKTNSMDIDIAAFTYNDAKYIRKEIQVNNEDIYFLYIYLDIFSKDEKELEYLLNKIEGIIESTGMQTRRANFRQEQILITCMPFMENNKLLKPAAKRNVLTSGIICTYPFISSAIFDENGIFYGTNIYNDSLIFIDKYNENKYKNANMCVFGTSGSGKSFFIKLQIIRYFLLEIEQYVIDPDREYDNIAKNLEGTIIKIGPSTETYLNVLDIRQDSIEDEKGFLATKVSKLIGFFNLIFGNMDEEEKAILEEKIIKCYNKKGITFDDNTLYKNEKNKINIKPIFKESTDMPILEDLYNILGEEEKTKKMQIKLIPFVKGSLKFFNNYTNIELNNKLIIADIYELGEENLKYGMYLFVDLFWDKIKENRKNKKIIYLDEVWRLIGITSNKNVASFIYKIFKTIRKYGGSSVAITQDISDLFSLENGTYGKSIINNSSNKAFFSLEEENISILSEYTNLSEKEKVEIRSLKRGESLLFAGDEHILTKIECADYEKEIINEK